MINPEHLFVETPDANRSRGMCQLNGGYTQGVNRVQGLAGHGFQRRFEAIRILRDADLGKCAR